MTNLERKLKELEVRIYDLERIVYSQGGLSVFLNNSISEAQKNKNRTTIHILTKDNESEDRVFEESRSI